jgi:hypothetical protein
MEFGDTGIEYVSHVRTDDIEAMQYPFLSHVLSLNDFLIAATLLPRVVPTISLVEMRHDLDLKKSPVRLHVPDSKLREKVSVVPDAWLDFRMTIPGREKPRRKCLVIEFDRGTTSINPLKQKLRALYYFACSKRMSTCLARISVRLPMQRLLGRRGSSTFGTGVSRNLRNSN